MVRQLRQGKGRLDLILSNTGILLYQHAMVSRLGPGPETRPIYRNNREDPRVVATERVPPVAVVADGEAAIEDVDVTTLAIVIKRLLVSNAHHFVANHGDTAPLRRTADR
ncbi:hypothetical protein Aspvir_001767 [Aspergillus viridinutans]|uniref:Uncharacterized protein n=1 Tax=Aspergillus viridinutans TaxID=75553 RepID=A0A9P3C1M8_ASPVI|nr:uncharacterized protein Aspvir_001767 [Aspergillus viridinutans]GIK06124.1 hypothetical protein Aspvir_001767 [Aspergillus viridinutans]